MQNDRPDLPVPALSGAPGSGPNGITIQIAILWFYVTYCRNRPHRMRWCWLLRSPDCRDQGTAHGAALEHMRRIARSHWLIYPKPESGYHLEALAPTHRTPCQASAAARRRGSLVVAVAAAVDNIAGR